MVIAVIFANQCDFLFDTLIIYYAVYWLPSFNPHDFCWPIIPLLMKILFWVYCTSCLRQAYYQETGIMQCPVHAQKWLRNDNCTFGHSIKSRLFADTNSWPPPHFFGGVVKPKVSLRICFVIKFRDSFGVLSFILNSCRIIKGTRTHRQTGSHTFSIRD